MMAGGGVRRYLNQDVNPWSTLLGVAAIIAVLALFASAGRGLIGLLVILGATLLWSVAARLRPGRTVEMHEVAHYASDCDRGVEPDQATGNGAAVTPEHSPGTQGPGYS